MPRLLRLLALGAIALAFVFTVTANTFAGIPNPADGRIYSCYSQSTGTWRMAWVVICDLAEATKDPRVPRRASPPRLARTPAA